MRNLKRALFAIAAAFPYVFAATGHPLLLIASGIVVMSLAIYMISEE